MEAEEMDCCGFFDQIDDFLDVPNDDVGATAASSLPPVGLDSFPGIWSDVALGTRSECSSFPCSDSVFSNSDLSAELSVPYEDIVQLEWLSSFVEDSFSPVGGGGGGGSSSSSSSSLTLDKPAKDTAVKQRIDHRRQTPSHISVLDSSSSCSAEKSTGDAIVPAHCGRSRSKRPRPTTVNFQPITARPLPPTVVSPASDNSMESCLLIEIPRHSKKKKIKFTLPAAPAASDGDGDPPTQPIRKCRHCEITKTPQWRAGPMGPKTLCNACGVRYKSGRLFPEYRPAASPTFVPTVHSNSHKKVLEMRNKAGGWVVNGGGSGAIELVPNARVGADY